MDNMESERVERRKWRMRVRSNKVVSHLWPQTETELSESTIWEFQKLITVQEFKVLDLSESVAWTVLKSWFRSVKCAW